MARFGARLTIEAAFKKLERIEAALESHSQRGDPLAAAASAEAKFFAFMATADSDDYEESEEWGEFDSDPLTRKFFDAIEALRIRLSVDSEE